MKPGWWLAGIIAAIAVGGTLLYLRRSGGNEGSDLPFIDDDTALNTFDAFPPEVSADEFDSLNYIF